MHNWLTIPQWLTVSSLTSKCETTLSSPLQSLLPICFSSVSTLSPSQLSLPHSPLFFFPLSFSQHKTFSISTHTPSIKLAYQISCGFLFLKTESAGASNRSACWLHVLMSLTRPHLSLPSPVYRLSSACYHCSFFHEGGLLWIQQVPHFPFCEQNRG